MQLAASAISRELGPVQKGLVTDPKTLIGDGATLLGFALKDLIGSVDHAPQISAAARQGFIPLPPAKRDAAPPPWWPRPAPAGR